MHIGNLIRQKVKEQNKTSVWLAEQLSCSRTNVYKLYDKKSIDTDTLFRLSSILKFDFFSIYSEEVLQKGLSHGTRQNRDCPMGQDRIGIVPDWFACKPIRDIFPN